MTMFLSPYSLTLRKRSGPSRLEPAYRAARLAKVMRLQRRRKFMKFISNMFGMRSALRDQMSPDDETAEETRAWSAEKIGAFARELKAGRQRSRAGDTSAPPAL